MRVSTAISAPFIVHSSPLLGQIDEPEDDIYDLFASYGNGRVYKNGSRTTFGLIIGTLIHDLYAVSQSITTAHIQHENSQLLVLSGGTASFQTRFSSCISRESDILHLSGPSKSLCGKTVEGHQNIISCPISFKESSITKTHLLALFTPPSCMKDSQKILTTVQFVLGQLDEVFDLQRFIELVEQEKWDEEAATFIAFRQTILTMLVSSPDDDDLRERFSTYRTIVMELDDPVLLSAGLVPVLMDMAVHEFLSVETATRKLIVLDIAQEYLFTNSILTKSLASLASMSASSPANVLLIATDPKRVNPSLFFHFDFLLLGHFNVHSVRWKKSLLSHLQIPSFMRDNGDTKLMQVRPNQCAIYSPDSIRVVSYFQQSGEEKEEAALWDETPILIELDDLVSVGLSPMQKLKVDMARSANVPVIFQRTKSGQDQATLEWLATEHAGKSGGHEERQEQSEPEFVNPLLSPAATNVGPVENIKKENGTIWINGAPLDSTTSKTSVSAFLSNEINLVGAPPTALLTQNQLAATVQNVKDKDPQPFSALESPLLPSEELKERGLHETRIYHPTDYDPKYRELVSAILCVTNGRINVKARYPKVLRIPIFKEDIGNSDGNRQHDEHETRKPITIPFCETRVAESRKLAWDDGVVQFGRDSEGVWVVLNPPRQPLRLSYERGGVTFEEQRIRAEGKLVKEQEPPSTPPSMTRAKEITEESRKEKKGLESTNKGKELRPETMGGSAITEEEAMKAVATSTESNLLHTSIVKSLNSGENELSGVPIVPTVTEPENKDTTPAAIFTRSIGEQKMPEASVPVPAAPSTSTSINFEPLCFAIRQVGGSKGQAVISLLSPPSNWKQESKFAGKWKNYIVAAVDAGVVSQGKINSKPFLKIRVDPSATSEVIKQVPAPIAPTNAINYFPLHYAIWRMCDLGGRALASRIESGMADGWKTGSGFDGTLNEYIDSAVDAGTVARDGYGSEVRLKVISSKVTKSDTSVSAPSLSPVPPPPLATALAPPLATAPPPPPVSTSAPAPLPASITPVKGISYLPLHAAIWKTCDGSGRALVSRIKPRIVTSWNVRSGFGGSLEEYVEMAVDARAVVRGGQGTEVWLMTYTGEIENETSMSMLTSTSTSTVSPVLPRPPPPVSNKGLSPATPEPIKSGVPVVPTTVKPEDEVTTPVTVLARSTGGQEKLEASVPVPAAPSTSTSINFEPLRGAIRTVCDGEGRALISQLVPPSNWKQESKFARKWKKYIVAAVEAGVVVGGEINSEPYLKIRADEAESVEISFASSHSAPPRAAQPVPVPISVPVPVPAPRSNPVPKAAEKVISYLPLHAAIWRTCDVGERALVSRIGSGMADGWKTGSGFGGTLEEYIEAAIDARKVVRGGKGSKAWLKIYTASVITSKAAAAAATMAQFQPVFDAIGDAIKDGHGHGRATLS